MLNDFTMEGNSMFPNILTFNANSGVWKLRQDGETNEIQMPKQVVMDLEVFQKGWNLILKGQAPQSHLVKYDKPFPAKPGEEFKKTFCIRMYAKDIGLCEFGSNSGMVGQAIQKFFNTYLEGRPDAVKVPVVAIKPNGKAGEWYVPNFEIVKYIARPEGLTEITLFDEPDLSMSDKPNENQFDDMDSYVKPSKPSSRKKVDPSEEPNDSLDCLDTEDDDEF
jgi:hypothetical protein